MSAGLVATGVGRRVDGRWLLRDVSLTVAPGTVVVVIGPNGAGKSTLLSLLAGDVAPTAGTVTVDGLDVARARPRDISFHPLKPEAGVARPLVDLDPRHALVA